MDTERTTLETALEHLPVGCTLIIYRTDHGEWYKVLLRDDIQLLSYQGGWAQLEQIGELTAHAIRLQPNTTRPPTADDSGR